MPPRRASQNSFVDPETYRAARILLQYFPDRVVELLAHKHDANQLLKDICSANGKDYHQLMSLDDSEHGNNAHSPRSGQTLSESAVVSSSSSHHPSSALSRKILAWIKDEEEPLSAKKDPQAHCIIRDTIVHDRLRLAPQHLAGPISVQYGHKFIQSCAKVSFTWRWSGSETGNTERSTFFLVSDPLDIDVVLGDLKLREDLSYGGPVQDLQRNSFDSTGIARRRSSPQHGFRLQQADLSTVVPTESRQSASTIRPATLGPSANRAGQVSEHSRSRNSKRRLSNSQIPRYNGSAGNSVASATGEQSRVSTRPTLDPSAVPAASLKNPNAGLLSVRLVCGDHEGVIKLALDAPGETFYNTLKREMKKRFRCELDRDVDCVRFALRKDCSGKTFHVVLTEDQLADQWTGAVDWINQTNETSRCRIYAIIEKDDDDEYDDD